MLNCITRKIKLNDILRQKFYYLTPTKMKIITCSNLHPKRGENKLKLSSDFLNLLSERHTIPGYAEDVAYPAVEFNSCRLTERLQIRMLFVTIN